MYPELYTFKYPKAGEDNSIVTIHIYDLLSEKTIQTKTGEIINIYIPRIKWTNDPEILSIIRLNRLQNNMEILHASAVTGESLLIYNESNKYYISEIKDNTLNYLSNGQEIILVSEQSGWRHIYRYNFVTKKISPITSGDYDMEK